MEKLLITIDGPAGSGKSTVSRLLADRLGYRYIDTGALYRAVGLEASEAGVDPDDEAAMGKLLEGIDLKFVIMEGEQRLLSGERDVSELIRTPEMSMMASKVSAKPVVRSFLLGFQRKTGEEKAVVFEGRDMGTVVFPSADRKFFLEASEAVRARRRYAEIGEKTGQTLEAVTRDMAVRDEQDRSREIAPLLPADDAIRIDSSDRTAEGVVAAMLSHIQ